MDEVWKPVAGYEGLYEVSNFGRVRSIDHTVSVVQPHRTYAVRIKGKVLRPIRRQHGYLGVQLYGRGGHSIKNMRTISIHRLVAEAFIENPTNLPEVNHKDENKANNRADNLEWMSHKDNTHFGTGITRRAQKQKNGACSRPVGMYSLDGEIIAAFPSLAEAQRQTGINKANIHSAINGRYTHAGGFKWRYTT